MTLYDPIWPTLNGGYKLPYDVSIPLKKLEATNNNIETDSIWEELWDNLHHQGDVGIASYLAIPQLVRIAKEKDIFDTNLLGLCCVVEQQKGCDNNPDLPEAYESYYQRGLNDLLEYALEHLHKNLNEDIFTYALATIVTCRGQLKLGKAIMEMTDPNIVDDFLDQF